MKPTATTVLAEAHAVLPERAADALSAERAAYKRAVEAVIETWEILPHGDGFIVQSTIEDALGQRPFVLSRRPHGPSLLDQVPPKVFKSRSAARAWMAKRDMKEAADAPVSAESSRFAPPPPLAIPPVAHKADSGADAWLVDVPWAGGEPARPAWLEPGETWRPVMQIHRARRYFGEEATRRGVKDTAQYLSMIVALSKQVLGQPACGDGMFPVLDPAGKLANRLAWTQGCATNAEPRLWTLGVTRHGDYRWVVFRRKRDGAWVHVDSLDVPAVSTRDLSWWSHRYGLPESKP